MRLWQPMLLLLVACGHHRPVVQGPSGLSAAEIVELSVGRPVMDPARVRFNIKLRSEKLDIAGSTGGALIVDRPGRGNFAVLGPLGSAILTAHADGAGLAVTISKDKQHLVALDGERVLREATAGAAGLDDILALLVGQLPFPDQKPSVKRQLDEQGRIEAHYDGPERTEVVALLDAATGTLREVSAYDKKGVLLLQATYGVFDGGGDAPYMPSELTLLVPALDLSVTLKYRDWKALETAPEDSVFSLAPPDGYLDASLEAVVRELASKMGER